MDRFGTINSRINNLVDYTRHSLLFVEAKHGVFIGLCLAILGSIASLISQDTLNQIIAPKCLCVTIGAIITFASWIMALCSSLWAVYPRSSPLKRIRVTSPRGILFRSESLAHYTEEQLMASISEGIEGYQFDNYQKQRINNIIDTARSTARKYQLFRLSLRLFIVSVAFAIATLILIKLP